MKQNLGSVDRILRFALAFWWLGPFAPQFEMQGVNIVIMIIGVIALIESMIGWCGLHHLFSLPAR